MPPHNSVKVMAQLEKILESPALGSAQSLRRFLRYVVEETLAGRGEALKEYSLGASVFGRGENFCPRTDPIVRVQARNLRLRLERYYAGPGADDPLVIEMPKGTYMPVFGPRELKARWRRMASAMIALAALLALLSVAVLEAHHPAGRPEPQKSRQYLSP
jgi:hypothetical protein